MRNAVLEEAQVGIKTAGRNTNNLRYADDTTFMAETEKAMAPHSSILACKISWMEEPGGLQSIGSQRVRHD